VATLGGSHRTGLRVAELLIHFFAQLAACAEQAETHGHRGDTQAVGNFLSGIVQHILQETNLAKIGGQLDNGTGEEHTHFLASQALFGIILVRGDAAADAFFAGADGLLERDDLAFAAAANDVDSRIGTNARDPGMKIIPVCAARAGELIEAGDGTQKSVLANVFGIAGIAGHAESGKKEPGGIRHDQSGEGFAIAAPGSGEKIGTGRGGLRGGTDFRTWRDSLVMLAAEADDRRVHLKAKGSSVHGVSRKAGKPPVGFRC
jgi:hypothetical protein